MSENPSDEEVRAAEDVAPEDSAQKDVAQGAATSADEAPGEAAPSPSQPPDAAPASRRSDRPPGAQPIVSALNSRPPSQPPPSAGQGAPIVEPMRPMRRIKLASSGPAPVAPTPQQAPEISTADESGQNEGAAEAAPAPPTPSQNAPSAPPGPTNEGDASDAEREASQREALQRDPTLTTAPRLPPSSPPPPRSSMGSTPDEASNKAPSLPPPRGQMGSGPSIEMGETTLDDLGEELEEADLSDLTLTPRADEVEPVSVTADAADDEAPASIEPEDDVLEELDATPAVTGDTPVVEVTPEPPSMEDFEVPPAERKPPPPRRSAKPALPQAQKPRNKPWWETLFGDDFSRAYRTMSDSQLKREVDFIVDSLGLPRGSVILDLGCGQGEICVELARRGYSIVGYDLSVYQLAMAGDLAQSAKQKINFLQGDMREMAFEAMFDGVLCWDTTFGYFEEEKNIDVLKRVLRALKPGGRFLLDVMNRDFAASQSPYSHWFEGDGCVCMDDMTMDWITNRMKVKRSIILDDGRSKELQYSVRLYGLYDIGHMMNDVGFRVTGISGDVATRGAFFGPNSRRMIIEAAKP